MIFRWKASVLWICCVLAVFGRICADSQQHDFSVTDSISATVFNDPPGAYEGGDAKRSPDGRYFWVITSRGKIASNEIESVLWLFDAREVAEFLNDRGAHRTNAPRPRLLARVRAVPMRLSLEPYLATISDVQWAHDSGSIFFLEEDSKGDQRLYKVEVGSGNLQAISPEGYGVRQYFLGERGRIAFTALRSDSSSEPVPWGPSQSINADAGSVTGLGLEDILFPLVGHGYGPGRFIPDLWIGTASAFRPVPDPSRHRIRGNEQSNNVLSLSPDGMMAVRLLPVSQVPPSWRGYEAKPGLESWRIDPDDPAAVAPANFFRLREYRLIDTRTGKNEALAGGPNGESLGEEDRDLAVWSRDGKRLLLGNVALSLNVSDELEREKRRHTCALASVEIPSRSIHCVVFTRDASAVVTSENQKPERLEDASFGATNDDVVLLFSWHGTRKEVERYHFQGGKWQLIGATPGTSAYERLCGPGFDSASNPNGPKLVIRQGLNDPPKLWAVETSRAQRSRLLWDPNPQFKRLRFGKAQVYRWKDSTGYEWTGVLVTPPDFVQGHRYPLVIQTHGVQTDMFLTDGPYPSSMAARELASAGIVVLQTTYRYDAAIATPAEGPEHVDEFISAIDHLTADGIIDPNKVGLIGFSRTCFHVESALVLFPHRFAAATLADGFTAGYMQYLLFGEGWPFLAKEFERTIGSSPFGDGLGNWFERSPGFHLDKITTPVRLEALSRTSLLTEWETYAVLRRLKKPVDLIFIPDGQHILQRPLDRLASQQGDVDWFRFWLEDYQDPNPAKEGQYRPWRHMRAELPKGD